MRLLSIAISSFVLAQAGVAEDEEPEKWALLQRAVLVEQDAEKIRSLVSGGLDLNDPIGCGTFAPLDGAVERENPELVELLLSLGAKPRDRQFVNAAFAANHAAGLQMVKLLRAAGVSVNARDYYLQTRMFTTALHSAVWRENVQLVRYLLSERGILLDEFDVDGYTPLMTAVRKGNREIFELLLAAGASPTVRNASGLDAAEVAKYVIAKQDLFLEKLKEGSSAR